MFVTSWIDARKQKLKEQERVILFDNNSHYPESSIGIGYCTGMRWWWDNFGNFYPVSHWMLLPKSPAQEEGCADFLGAVFNCAVRYGLGRQTYMPGLIIDEIKPLLPMLSPKTLGCMERDIRKADVSGSGWGDVAIDKPKWMEFLKEIQKEMDLRGIARCQ